MNASDSLKMHIMGGMVICRPLYERGEVCSCKDKDCTECRLGAEYILRR